MLHGLFDTDHKGLRPSPDVFPCQNGANAGHQDRRGGVDAQQFGMRMG
jgi:hypothetical protein